VLPTVFGGAAFLALALATALTVGNVRTADRESDGQAQPSVSSVTDTRRMSLSAAYAELSAALKNAAYERLAAALNGHVTRLRSPGLAPRAATIFSSIPAIWALPPAFLQRR